jgi:threonine dehydrogenase-like Zn-dependent dehydrogenase
MAPYMSETGSVDGTHSAAEHIKPSGIRVVIVGAGFAGITAAIECSRFRLYQLLVSRSHEAGCHIADENC